MQRHIWTGSGDKGSWEEYRYDALGRRVLVISRFAARPPACDSVGYSICAGLCTVGDCGSKVLYTVWDGAAMLREDREPYPGGSTNSAYHAAIEYVHGPELDKPLAALDTRVSGNVRILNPNWRGLFESSLTASGTSADCAIPPGGSCQNVTWPAGQPIYQRALPFDFGGGTTITWAGSLLADGQDGTGQLYRRNRYYDPDAGRFTQEDPIGLAGGMNLYGFAGGDPVNFSDPLGLCPKDVGGDGKTEAVKDCSAEVKGAWADKHVQVNPNTDWDGVDAGLRDAVVLGSMEMRADFYVSAGKESGHATTSAHHDGLAVDVSRVNGTRLGDMSRSQARALGNQVGATIANFMPFGRGREVFTPGMAFRFDMNLSAASRNSLMASHWNHVHVSLIP